jgi:choline-sulfatase
MGRLLDALKQAGLEERTVVVYTSDHGEMLGKFGMWWKCSLYEDSARVPLLAAGPGFAKGEVVETPVDLHDLQAALFEATGHWRDRPEEWVGTPLQEIPVNDPERVVFSEYHGHGTRASGYLIRKGDWKLLYYLAASHQLFNLKQDPEELNNLVESNQEKVRELEDELRRICSPILENQRAEDCIHLQMAELDQRGLLPKTPSEGPIASAEALAWSV